MPEHGPQLGYRSERRRITGGTERVQDRAGAKGAVATLISGDDISASVESRDLPELVATLVESFLPALSAVCHREGKSSGGTTDRWSSGRNVKPQIESNI